MCFKIVFYVLFAPHSNKHIIILELKMHQHSGTSTNLLDRRDSPHWSPMKRQICSAIYFSWRDRVLSGPHTHTHAYLGTGFPQHHALKWDGTRLSAKCHINIYGSYWLHRGLFLTDKDIQRSNPCQWFLLKYASRQQAYLNLFFNLSYNTFTMYTYIKSSHCTR